MDVIRNVFYILFGLLFIISIVIILNLILAIADYIDSKRQHENKQTESEVYKDLYVRSKTLKVESETIGTILISIDNLIALEISSIFKTYIGLGQKYEYLKLEEDIQTVATEVFNGLRKEYFFSNDHSILTDEYIMRYIQTQTMIMFLNTVRKYNQYVKFR